MAHVPTPALWQPDGAAEMQDCNGEVFLEADAGSPAHRDRSEAQSSYSCFAKDAKNPPSPGQTNLAALQIRSIRVYYGEPLANTRKSTPGIPVPRCARNGLHKLPS